MASGPAIESAAVNASDRLQADPFSSPFLVSSVNDYPSDLGLVDSPWFDMYGRVILCCVQITDDVTLVNWLMEQGSIAPTTKY